MKEYFKAKFQPKHLIFLCFSVVMLGCTNRSDENNKSSYSDGKTLENKINANTELIAVTPPPFSDGIFPCNDCHKDQKPNPVRRKLVDMHDDISEMFNHDPENRWCLDCHDLNNRDSLKLASGKLLDFKESYKLCGQCHGDKLRDWKVGVHGKRIGEWNGKKEYFLCVSCHNPHSPKFKQLKPEPPPYVWTNEIIRK
jgi:hypothetical protein